MNYTLIGYIEGSATFDSCGDLITKDSELTILSFRDDREAFIAAWAKMVFDAEYDQAEALFNGINYDDLTAEEAEKYGAAAALEEMEAALGPLKLAHERWLAAERERLALAAEEKARQLARLQRARDLAEYQELKKKLGL